MRDSMTPHGDAGATLGEQLDRVIRDLPGESLTLGELLDVFGDEGLLLLTMLLTVIFLIPVSIPGVSTVFGAAILMVGISRVIGRPLWLPTRVRNRALPVARLRPGLEQGMAWVHRLEKISRPRRLNGLVDGRARGQLTNLAFVLAAVLLMAPFGFVPFSNTLPALALLLYSVGMMQRDGGAVLLGHLANIATIVYFAVLIGGGGVALRELWQRMAG